MSFIHCLLTPFYLTHTHRHSDIRHTFILRLEKNSIIKSMWTQDICDCLRAGKLEPITSGHRRPIQDTFYCRVWNDKRRADHLMGVLRMYVDIRSEQGQWDKKHYTQLYNEATAQNTIVILFNCICTTQNHNTHYWQYSRGTKQFPPQPNPIPFESLLLLWGM